MTTKIEFEITIHRSPAAVWRSLTQSSSLKDWLMANDFAPELGKKFSFFPSSGKPIACRVADLDAEKLLAYWWDDGESGEPSLVTWRLTPTDGGTDLRLEHTRFERVEVTRLELATNWSAALDRITPVVFMSDEEEADPKRRLIGIRDRQEVTA
jgi:uncharacterized protein YndB with AHSA1/START domain